MESPQIPSPDVNAAIARLRTGDISRLDDDFRDVLVHKFPDYFHNFGSEDLMYFECFTLISEVLDSDYSMGLAMWNALQAVTPTGWLEEQDDAQQILDLL